MSTGPSSGVHPPYQRIFRQDASERVLQLGGHRSSYCCDYRQFRWQSEGLVQEGSGESIRKVHAQQAWCSEEQKSWRAESGRKCRCLNRNVCMKRLMMALWYWDCLTGGKCVGARAWCIGRTPLMTRSGRPLHFEGCLDHRFLARLITLCLLNRVQKSPEQGYYSFKPAVES